MSDNVRSLYGSVPVGPPAVDDRICNILEELLVQARDGKLHGFLYATVELDGSIGTGWRGSAETFRMIAAVNRLFFRVNDDKEWD
jgi:hypothetical protein